MEALYGIPFHVLEVPNLKLKKPGWVKAPSAMVVFAFVLLSYFLVTGGKFKVSSSDLCFVSRGDFEQHQFLILAYTCKNVPAILILFRSFKNYKKSL